MTILIAPDKFKGSLSAQEVCDAIRETLLAAGQELYPLILPLADGGEGTCELLTSFSGGTLNTITVSDPLARKIDVLYGISKDGKTAFLEMAKASGLQLLTKEERNPWWTTTAGTGDMIRHVLDLGVEEIIMGIGGSATNDAGMGMCDALGIHFYSASGERLDGIGKNMSAIKRIDLSAVHPRLKTVRFTIFCDVDNPLHGPQGAAYIFSPQKGADDQTIKQLDAGLRHYEQVLESVVHKKLNFPGAGAGGGLPASVKAFANVMIRPGMEFIVEFTRLEEQVSKADVVITGEGKTDEQTLSGKVVKGVADLASRYKKPLFVIAGKNELSAEKIKNLGIQKLVTLTSENVSEEEAVSQAYHVLKKQVKEELIPLFLSPRQP